MNVDDVAFLVLAKAPRPGRVKTRLCPPCTPSEAAALAEAALRDTVAAVAATGARRRVLVLDGPAGPWVPHGFTLLAQRGHGLDERLAAAFDDAGGPAVLVGMDTPQLTATLLRRAARMLVAGSTGAVLGPAVDGGYWSIGLRRAESRAFLGVPMSTSDTGRAQVARLRALGLGVRILPRLRDVDVFSDALTVARQAPRSRFAAAVGRLATRESVA